MNDHLLILGASVRAAAFSALRAGMHVLADKPWIIRPEDLPALEQALALSREKGLTAYDIMTERYEITSILQRELVNSPTVFGDIVPGSEAEPCVYMHSVHHLLKLVAGVPGRGAQRGALGHLHQQC